MTQQPSSINLVVVRLPPEIMAILGRALEPTDVRQDVFRVGDKFMPKYPLSQAVIKRLNEAFGGAWSDQVMSVSHAPDQSEVIVHVRLTIYVHCVDTVGAIATIHHDGLGRAYLKRGPQGICDYGNDLKAAHTDGLRKAATKFGYSLELYERDESAFQGMSQMAQQPPNASNTAAPGFQVAKVVDLLENGWRLPREYWLKALQLHSPEQMTVVVATAILAGQHPFIVHLHQSSGQPPQQRQGVSGANA